MKFTMFRKETENKKYRNNSYGVGNFTHDEEGYLVCPNWKKFHYAYRKEVRGNQYGRKEEIYTCKDCSGCPYASECKKGDKNRTIKINEELTSFHEEVM